MIIRAIGIFLFLSLTISCNNSAAKDDAVAQLANDSITKAHTNAWTGTYHGTVPNAKSVGLDMTLSLNPSNTYELRITHLEKNPKNNTVESFRGEIEWHEDSTTIILNEIDSMSNKFKIKPGEVLYLNSDATPNSGELAEFYILKKE